MNQSLKIFIKIYLLFLVGAVHASNPPATLAAIPTPGGDPQGGGTNSWYTDKFGPTRSNYSMGDLVRYDVTPGTTTPAQNWIVDSGKGFNIYYSMVNFPYGKDVYNYNNNAYNLYNFVGNLYAGWAALNIYPSANTKSNWLGTFRQSGQGNYGQGSLMFDNNTTASYTIRLIDVVNMPFTTVATGLVYEQVSIDQGKYFLNAHIEGSVGNASASCAWNTNSDDGNYVLAVPAWGNGYAAPYGQFFGARLSHILGAVVNDVPAESNNANITSMPTGTPVPQMAVFTGGPAAYAGATTPSTAHFGTMQNYLTDISSPTSTVFSGIKKLQRYSYLINHLLPAVTRFATGGSAAAAGSTPATTPLCSYSMGYTSDERNLIEINSSAVTGYDNGVIIDIQNHTDDSLIVKQLPAPSLANSATATPVIGTLGKGTNNYFLHTASLMNLPAGSTQTLPAQTNMIEIKDANIAATDMPSIYISVVSAAQVGPATQTGTILGNISAVLGTALPYNYESPATPSATAQYLLVTNFNPNSTVPVCTTTSCLAAAYRLQALDVSQFNGMPYFVTLQISKEQIKYGLSNTTPVVIDQGISKTAMLKCSMVSVKTCSWNNPYAVAEKLSYSQIPLLLIPDSVLNLKNQGYSLNGLQAHYGIWLMAYAAALTEFQFSSKFGDNIACAGNTFGLFDVKNQAAPARVVIDANGSLVSGKTLVVQSSKQHKQSADGYLSLMGCDVWDGGMNQDIPILYLYEDAAGNVVANQYTSPADQTNGNITYNNINFSVTFKNTPTKSASAFAQGYGQPYSKTLLFSLPTLNPAVAPIAATATTAAVPGAAAYPICLGIPEGVTATLTQLVAGTYLLTFFDQDQNVLAFQKVYLSNPPTSMTINFLSTPDGQWNSPVTLPVGSLPVGQSQTFTLTYSRTNGKNVLSAKNQQAEQALANITTLVGDYTTLAQQNINNLTGTYTMEDITNAYNAAVTAINSAIQTYPTLTTQFNDQLNAINKQQQRVQGAFAQQQQQEQQQSQQSQQQQPGGF